MSMTVASVDEMNRSYMLEDNSLPFLILATKLQLRNLHMNMKKMNVIQSEGWPPKDLLSWSQKRQSSLRKLVRWFYFYVKTKVTETLRNQTSNRWLAGIRIVDKAQRSGTVEVNDLCRYSMKTREVNQKSRFFFVFVSPPPISLIHDGLKRDNKYAVAWFIQAPPANLLHPQSLLAYSGHAWPDETQK